MGLSHWTILVLGDGFVELIIFFLFNVVWLPCPDWLCFIAQLPVPSGLLNLSVLLNRSFFILSLVLLLFILSRGILSILLILLNWFLNCFSRRSPQEDVEIDELRILFDQVSNSILL